ncbi:MAG: hypothetical protein ACYSW3_19255 [Planctomycetota bacterium]|jgi:hypothetical protein
MERKTEMKNTLSQKITFLVCGVVILGMIGCQEPIQIKSGGTYHLNYNFHYTTERGRRLGSVANFTKVAEHKILPYGSRVKVKSWRSGFSLIDEKTGNEINVLCRNRFLRGKSLSEYFDLILSNTTVSYTGLSEIDKKGISEGRPYKGMSKKGVMIALGYPCPYRTPSPDVDVWYYWKNRFRNYTVNFENDLVVSSGY